MDQTTALGELRRQYSSAFTHPGCLHSAFGDGQSRLQAADPTCRCGSDRPGDAGELGGSRQVQPPVPSRTGGQAADLCFPAIRAFISWHDRPDPSAIYGVTCGRGGDFPTPLGRVSLHHVGPGFFVGYDTPTEIGWLKIAVPEKAIVDVLYLRMTSIGDFKGLPEIEWPKNFSWERARKFARLTPPGAGGSSSYQPWRTCAGLPRRKLPDDSFHSAHAEAPHPASLPRSRN